MFLLSLLTNKDLYNTQITQCVNDTIFRKRFRVPGFGNGSGNLGLRQVTIKRRKFRPKMRQNAFGGRAPPGPAGGA